LEEQQAGIKARMEEMEAAEVERQARIADDLEQQRVEVGAYIRAVTEH
jgi:hypothetical protein